MEMIKISKRINRRAGNNKHGHTRTINGKLFIFVVADAYIRVYAWDGTRLKHFSRAI